MPLSGGGAAPEHNKGTADTGGDREESLRRVFPAPPPPPTAPHPSTLIYFYLFLAGSGALARRGAAAPL